MTGGGDAEETPNFAPPSRPQGFRAVAGVAQDLHILQELMENPVVGQMINFQPFPGAELIFGPSAVVAAFPMESQGVETELLPLRGGQIGGVGSPPLRGQLTDPVGTHANMINKTVSVRREGSFPHSAQVLITQSSAFLTCHLGGPIGVNSSGRPARLAAISRPIRSVVGVEVESGISRATTCASMFGS